MIIFDIDKTNIQRVLKKGSLFPNKKRSNLQTGSQSLTVIVRKKKPAENGFQIQKQISTGSSLTSLF